jgi:hypothetical protein
MQRTKQPVSKLKVVLMWLVFLGVTIFCVLLATLGHRHEAAPAEEESDIVRFIVMLVLAGFFLAGGVGGYFLMLLTNCFTFNYHQPVWRSMKGKLYLANIVVLTGLGLGLGFALSPFIHPLLSGFGLSGEIALLIPVMTMLVALQVIRIFILIWAPMERRLITRRLQARGITPEQLQSAFLVGISDPTRSSFKKLTQVEEDIGAMWVGPDQLVYWGDEQDFAVRREQLTQIERRADAGGTTMLTGITHIILHVLQAEGSERQVRLHTEGYWTMGGKGRAMDQLEDAIVRWHGGVVEGAVA